MKSFSNKNSSDNHKKKSKNKANKKNYSKSSWLPDQTSSAPPNNRFNGKPEFNKNKINLSNQKDKRTNFLKNSNSKNSHTGLKHEPTNYLENNTQNPSKKNFDDWIWGKHSVYAALTSERAINRIWCTSDIFSSEKFYLLLKKHKSDGVLVEEVSWNRLSQITFGATHQGVAIQLAHSKSVSLDKLISLSFTNSQNPIILALDGITDPHNLGAIVRSAEAFNCKGIIIPQRRSSGLTGTVAKVAAGALEHIPVSRVINLNRALEELKRNGFLTVGLCGEGQSPISKFKEKAPLVVIIGAEDKGISLLTQKKCDYLLRIPLKGKTSSLNASVAAAISIFYLTNM